jgi:type IV secretory pathway VirB9-like protein
VPHSRARVCVFCIVGVASGQESATSIGSRTATAGSVPISHSPVNRINVDPVVLNRAALDEKVITLRLVPRMATSIRMPEPVNSVVLGDPDNFLAEHSEHEPEMVTVKPVNSEAARTNLLITTTRGHQVNLLLVSNGEKGACNSPWMCS